MVENISALLYLPSTSQRRIHVPYYLVLQTRLRKLVLVLSKMWQKGPYRGQDRVWKILRSGKVLRSEKKINLTYQIYVFDRGEFFSYTKLLRIAAHLEIYSLVQEHLRREVDINAQSGENLDICRSPGGRQGAPCGYS